MALIERVELQLVNLEPPVVRTDAIQSFAVQETIIARITDADGAVGTGYSYTIGTGGHSVMALLEHTLAPFLIGREADAVEAVWRGALFRTHATAVGAITSLALAAVDTALWDMRCIKAGRPLWQLAGGAKPGVALYSTEGGWLQLELDELIADAISVQDRGFRGAKIKIGKPKVAEDRERLLALREAVGGDFDIMVDANQCFSLPGAMRRVAVLEEAEIAWFEEPLPADDVDAHRRLAQQSAVPIAVGESLYSLAQFKEYLQAGACSIVQADVARVGGITPWLKVAHLAEAYNVPICPHFLMELHLSLSCAVSNSPWLEYIPQLDAITGSNMQIQNGYAVAPSTPGLGVDWDWDAVAAHTAGSISVIDT